MNKLLCDESLSVCTAINRVKSRINIPRWIKAFKYYYSTLEKLGIDITNYKLECNRTLSTLKTIKGGIVVPSSEEEQLERHRRMFESMKKYVRELAGIEKLFKEMISTAENKKNYVEEKLEDLLSLYYQASNIIKTGDSPYNEDALSKDTMHSIQFNHEKRPLHLYYPDVIRLEERYRNIILWSENNRVRNAEKSVSDEYLKAQAQNLAIQERCQ